MSKHRAAVETPAQTAGLESIDMEALAQAVKNVVHDELGHMIADIEFRLGRLSELERRAFGAESVAAYDASLALPDGSVYAEDIVSSKHQITGYTVTANSPGAGSIAWTNVHVVYNGVDYVAADGNTALRYVYFIKPGSGTTVTLTSSDTKPSQAVLGVGGALIFVNNAGTPTSVLESSIPAVVGDNAIDGAAIMNGAVGDTKISGVTAGKVSGVLADGNIPTLDAAKIGSGALADARIPALAASKITSGTFLDAQIPALDAAKIATGTIPDARIGGVAASKVSGSLALGNIPVLDATKIGAGTVTPIKMAIATHLMY
jgi:hypothetical protein